LTHYKQKIRRKKRRSEKQSTDNANRSFANTAELNTGEQDTNKEDDRGGLLRLKGDSQNSLCCKRDASLPLAVDVYRTRRKRIDKVSE
jgi:hypothetical protein